MRWTVGGESVAVASALTPGTLLFLNSQAGGYMARAQGASSRPPTGHFTASRSFDNGLNSTSAGNAPGDFWSVDLAAPCGARRSRRASTRAPRAGRSDGGGRTGLSVSGDGRGCNTLTGRLRGARGDLRRERKVRGFAADFEQHCEARAGALRVDRYHGPIRLRRRARRHCVRRPDACTQSDAVPGGPVHGRATGACSAAPPLPHRKASAPVRRRLRGAGSNRTGTPCSDGNGVPRRRQLRERRVHGGGSLFLRATGPLYYGTTLASRSAGCVFAPVPSEALRPATDRVAAWAGHRRITGPAPLPNVC